jgi:holo-[acyl-carrier protein] synthase
MDDEPLLFTPLIGQAGTPISAWPSAPPDALAVSFHPPQGVNIAVGIDIIEVERVHRTLAQHGERFLQRIYTSQEIEQCRGKAIKLAGRFAAKEAISKALGTGMRGISWHELEVVQLSTGRPTVRLYGNARLRAEQLNLSACDVSISDLAQFSIAVAVAVQTTRTADLNEEK